MFHIALDKLLLLNSEHDLMPTSINNLVYLTLDKWYMCKFKL